MGGTSASDGPPICRIATVITIDSSVSDFGDVLGRTVRVSCGQATDNEPKKLSEEFACARCEMENGLKIGVHLYYGLRAPCSLTGPFFGVLERLCCLHRPSGRIRAERPFPRGFALTAPLKAPGSSRRTEQ